METTPEFLTVRDIAQATGLSLPRTYALIAEGSIPSVRLGERRIRVPRASWEAFVEVKAQEAMGNLTAANRDS